MLTRAAKRRQDYPPVKAKNPAIVRMSRDAQKTWLESSKHWKDLSRRARVGRWRPLKILGAGAASVVGLWEVIDDVDLFGNDRLDPDLPTMLAIKQGGPGEAGRRNMQWESHLLQQLMNSASQHIVKIYKGFHLDMGSGTHEHKDPIPYDAEGRYDETQEVCRMYLEYCEEGDLQRLGRHFDYNYRVPEEQVWRLMLCIFKGLLVLERGTEDASHPVVPALWTEPIVHDEVLIGRRDATEHRRLEAFKIADFGLALPIPAGTNKDGRNWIGRVANRGTDDHMPPEQFYVNNPPQNYPIDEKTGVWSAASTIFQFCTATTIDKSESCVDPQTGFLSICSPHFLFDTNQFPYSRRLALTLSKCLSWRPSDRPRTIDVVRIAQTMADMFDTHHLNQPILGNELRSQNQPNIRLHTTFTGVIPVSIPHNMVQRGRTPFGPAGPMPAPNTAFPGARPFDFPIVKWAPKPLKADYVSKNTRILYDVPAALIRAAQEAARRAAQMVADALANLNAQAAWAAANPPQGTIPLVAVHPVPGGGVILVPPDIPPIVPALAVVAPANSLQGIIPPIAAVPPVIPPAGAPAVQASADTESSSESGSESSSDSG